MWNETGREPWVGASASGTPYKVRSAPTPKSSPLHCQTSCNAPSVTASTESRAGVCPSSWWASPLRQQLRFNLQHLEPAEEGVQADASRSLCQEGVVRLRRFIVPAKPHRDCIVIESLGLAAPRRGQRGPTYTSGLELLGLVQEAVRGLERPLVAVPIPSPDRPDSRPALSRETPRSRPSTGLNRARRSARPSRCAWNRTCGGRAAPWGSPRRSACA